MTPREIAERIDVISTSISIHTVSKRAAKAVLTNLIHQALAEQIDRDAKIAMRHLTVELCCECGNDIAAAIRAQVVGK